MDLQDLLPSFAAEFSLAGDALVGLLLQLVQLVFGIVVAAAAEMVAPARVGPEAVAAVAAAPPCVEVTETYHPYSSVLVAASSEVTTATTGWD